VCLITLLSGATGGSKHFLRRGLQSLPASASTLMFAGAAIGIISAFKGFWWVIAIGILNWFLMGFVSRAFNPTNFLVDPLELMGHE